METMYFEVVSIDGDYANLKRTDAPSDDLRVVARALLFSFCVYFIVQQIIIYLKYI
jgi:hypothetical protein